MDRIAAMWLLAVLQLCFVGALSSTNCCNGRNTEVETVGCSNKDCNTNCDCSAENCDSCQGYDRCCQSCCNTNCDCRSVSCNSCSTVSNECCSSCCNTKCRSSSCSSRQCRSCNCDSCSTRTFQNSACCNSCCKEQQKIDVVPSSSNISQITTLPNITIIINHAPIYVNNTPVITNEQRCGNASVLTNGTHIVYVYPQNSTCNNRTCCSRVVRRPCQPPLPPLPPLPPMPPVCPPPVYVSDCSPRCMYPPQPMPMPMPMPMPVPVPQPQPCQYFQSWPYVHCPQTGCYGFSCAPPMPMGMPVPQAPPIYSGCIPLQTWPFMRCIQGVGGDSVVNYGSPSYQVQAPGVDGPQMPFSSGDHSFLPASSMQFAPGAGAMPN